MSILQLLTQINGVAQIWAADGQFLGLLSTDRYDPNSISNFQGNHGSYHGIYSIRNPHGLYGGEHGMYSPYNPYCNNPPIITYQGQPVLMVTRNSYAHHNKSSIIDPDFLLGVYVQLGYSPGLFNDSGYRMNQQAAIIASMFH